MERSIFCTDESYFDSYNELSFNDEYILYLIRDNMNDKLYRKIKRIMKKYKFEKKNLKNNNLNSPSLIISFD